MNAQDDEARSQPLRGSRPAGERHDDRHASTRDDDGRTVVHIAPDDLAAIAVDESMAESDERAHLQWCTRCADEVATVRRVTERASRAAPSDPEPTVPDRVWDRVVQELSSTGDLRPVAAPASDPAATGQRRDPAADGPVPARRSARRWQPLAAAAALVLLVVVAAVVLLPLTGPDVVASADLEALAEVPASSATLTADGDRQTLQLGAVDLPDIDGYYELWLLTDDGQGLVSLGPVDGQSTVEIPASIDTDRFGVVDISREPSDGDPTHSTDSVLRGRLEASA